MKLITMTLQIITIVKKNIKRLLSSKLSAAMVVFGPLILIVLMGLAFQGSGFYGVQIGIYEEGQTNTTSDLLDIMKKSDFKIIQTQSKEQCINKVKDGTNHMCMIFPKNYENEKMEFYVDYSRMNLVYAIVSRLSGQINELSSDISMGMTQDLLNFIKQSANLMAQSSTSLIELQRSSELLSAELSNIQQAIGSLNFNNTIQVLNQISNSESPTNQQIQNTQIELNNAKIQLQVAETQLKDTEQTINTQINEINNAMTQLSCTETNSNDLSSQLKTQGLAALIQTQDDPTCSLLITIRETLKKEKEKTKLFQETTQNMQDYINSIIQRVSTIQQQAQGQANETQQNIQDMQQNQQSLTQNLQGMTQATNQSAQAIQTMTQQLNTLQEQFEKIANSNAQTIIKPIKTSIKSLTTKKINTLEMLFPSIIIMVILFEGILLGNTLIMREKKSKAFFRNQILPVSDYLFNIGTYITAIILTSIQVLIVLIIGLLLFKINVVFNPLTIIPILILSILIFSSIGMLIGYLSTSDETAILIAVILTIILLMFSNLVIPTETMQRPLGDIAKFTPFNISEEVLRRTLIFGSKLLEIKPLYTLAFLTELTTLLACVLLAHKKAFSKKN
ncbi:ABC transporter permease [Candidatus Woesearchaeota archaeon]|nr:ABC transporter permease [Candidatus Woesearchaeota archaeon]